MKIYKYSDRANEYVGFVIHEPKKQIIYIRWESPEPIKYVFGKFGAVETFTPEDDLYNVFDDMEQEILDKETDYGEYVDIEKGDEHLIIKGLFGAG